MLHNEDLLPRTRQKSGMQEQLCSTWSAITSTLQTHSPSPFPASSLLPSLTPLLICTLTSNIPKLRKMTLNFWVLTFDKEEALVYPNQLSKAFQTYLSSSPRPHGLRLPGLEGVSVGGVSEKFNEVSSVEDSMPVSDSNAAEMPEIHSHSEAVVVLPNNSPLKAANSPRKNVCSSFLGSGRQTPLARPHPISPGSKSLDRVLSRLSPYRADSSPNHSRRPPTGIVCRKLPLDDDATLVSSHAYCMSDDRKLVFFFIYSIHPSLPLRSHASSQTTSWRSERRTRTSLLC